MIQVSRLDNIHKQEIHVLAEEARTKTLEDEHIVSSITRSSIQNAKRIEVEKVLFFLIVPLHFFSTGEIRFDA